MREKGGKGREGGGGGGGRKRSSSPSSPSLCWFGSMAFRNNPFQEGTDIFPKHDKIYGYLRGYADNNEWVGRRVALLETRGLNERLAPSLLLASLRRTIQFSTLVTRIYHTPGEDVNDEERWTVETRPSGGEGETTSERFSHVGE